MDEDKNNEDEIDLEELDHDEEISDKFKKILVVDDIMYVVKSISRILRSEGYFVITATTGSDALAKFMKYSPDLITIDQKLPDMTGSTLAQKIRDVKDVKKPKIIFITAVYEKDEVKAILNIEIDNYLLKPFKKNKLIEVVNELVGKD